MSTVPSVTVLLPLHTGDERARRALADIASQSVRDIEILILLNGSDGAAAALASDLARSDPRARVVTSPEAHLARALNVGLRAARAPIAARMDADDRCPPGRLAAQLAALRAGLAAVGCAWEIVDSAGRRVRVVRPPTDPGRMRWRLRLGNMVAHGSMVMRVAAVVGAGGYDERLERAQDHELWLRLTRDAPVIGATDEVVYSHTTRHEGEPDGSDPAQAWAAAGAMAASWVDLPRAGGESLEAIRAGMSRALLRGPASAEGVARLEGELDIRPSLEGLSAYLWARTERPSQSWRAVEAGRCALLRELGARLRSVGVRRVWLWGAGDHTRWVLERVESLGLEIGGLVDDALAGGRAYGWEVRSPEVLGAGDVVVLSSDWHEEALWAASAGARARGVRVERLYAAATGRAEEPAGSPENSG